MKMQFMEPTKRVLITNLLILLIILINLGCKNKENSENDIFLGLQLESRKFSTLDNNILLNLLLINKSKKTMHIWCSNCYEKSYIKFEIFKFNKITNKYYKYLKYNTMNLKPIYKNIRLKSNDFLIKNYNLLDKFSLTYGDYELHVIYKNYLNSKKIFIKKKIHFSIKKLLTKSNIEKFKFREVFSCGVYNYWKICSERIKYIYNNYKKNDLILRLIKNNYLNNLSFLLREGYDCNIIDANNKTAYDYAYENRYGELERILNKYSCKRACKILKTKCKSLNH